MFHWLTGEKAGLAQIFQHFGQMLEDGRHIFDAAANAVVGGTDPATVKDDLIATDKRINKIEQRVRRELIVHMSVANRTDFPVCFALMSLVKDAERIGDYAKNILELAEHTSNFHQDALAADIIEVKDRTSRALAKMRNLFDSQDEALARAYVDEMDDILKTCNEKVNELVQDAKPTGNTVAAALMYRYVKRVTAHAMNIVSSVIMPIDKLDYFDEDPEHRE